MFLMAVAVSMTNPAERWVPVGGSAGLYEEYVDRDSIARSDHKVTLWTRRDFLVGQVTVWNELELDCLMRTETLLAYIQDSGGTVSHNFDRPHREARPIAPRSVEERIFDIACSQGSQGRTAP